MATTYTTYTTTRHDITPLYRGTQIIWYLFYVIETMLAFRFLLKLLGANAGASFTQFVYTLSSPFANPFRNVILSQQVYGSVIEWSTLLAILVYWIIAWGIVRLFAMGRPVSNIEAQEKLNRQDIVD